MENGTRMKRIASQTQIYADFFLGFSSSGGVAEGRGGFFFGAQSCTEFSTELHKAFFKPHFDRLSAGKIHRFSLNIKSLRFK